MKALHRSLATAVWVGVVLAGCSALEEPGTTDTTSKPSDQSIGQSAAPAAKRIVQAPAKRGGVAEVEVHRPKHFPHRIWAACDFEARTTDYGWFGTAETQNIPQYPGNVTALRSRESQKYSSRYVGINPVPGPRMGEVNKVYFRYYVEGTTDAQVQHFNLSENDNHHIRVSGLTEGGWSQATPNFTADSKRNDGSPGAMKKGDRMDDLKIYLGRFGDGKEYDIIIDDVIFFAEAPSHPPDFEPFPNRVIFLAAFDTGEKDKYWPGSLEIVDRRLPADSYWRVARAVPHENPPAKWIRLQIQPPKPVGEMTKLRFRYHVTGASAMTVQIFDMTDMDNRHIRLSDLPQGVWQTANLNFTRDAKRNDGSDTPFAAGHVVDDIFFFVSPDGDQDVDLLIDEVVLYDAGCGEIGGGGTA
ncbi:MAG TPA: hypothetical protein VMZ31_06735 [Phycisphaerae bacterium]|nr:hypothetical protein [Phycisphaerae bacterium]